MLYKAKYLCRMHNLLSAFLASHKRTISKEKCSFELLAESTTSRISKHLFYLPLLQKNGMECWALYCDRFKSSLYHFEKRQDNQLNKAGCFLLRVIIRPEQNGSHRLILLKDKAQSSCCGWSAQCGGCVFLDCAIKILSLMKTSIGIFLLSCVLVPIFLC